MRKAALVLLVACLFLVVTDTGKAAAPINVPPSLMLHSHSAEFLPEFLDLISQEGYTTITYRDYAEALSCRLPQKKYIIISIDDFGPNGITPSLRTMTEELKKRDMVAVIGLITGRLDAESWNYLSELEKAGFEIASHTLNHSYLPGLSSNTLKEEVLGSSNVISEHLAKPVSLILPYGGFDQDKRIIEAAQNAGYKFIVGISGGEQVDETSNIYYVGRESPNIKSAKKTLVILEERFATQNNGRCKFQFSVKKKL